MSAAILQSVSPTSSARRVSKSVITGRVLSGIAIAFLTFDTSLKLLQSKAALDTTSQLGFSSGTVLPLGIVELLCLVLYVIPRTAPLGALLFTGYLGGAIAIHVQNGNPLFSHVLFPTYVAALLWGGLYLRDSRVRNAIAPR